MQFLRSTHAATHCHTLQHTATVWRTATHWNYLQNAHVTIRICNTKEYTHYNTLRHTAAHCSTLQHTAAPCDTLRHTANTYSMHIWHLKPPSRDLSQTFQFSLAPSPPPLPPDKISKVSSTVILLNRFSRKLTFERFYLSSHNVPNEDTSTFLRRKRGGVIIYCVTWLKRLASTSCSRFVQYTCFFLCWKRRRKRGGVILWFDTVAHVSTD